MAYNPRAVDLKLREQRQRVYQTAQTISSCFPALEHIALQIGFTGADRKRLLSPYKQIYTGNMQAYFHLQCPSKECDGGGFDVSNAITDAVKSKTGAASGSLDCSGKLSAGGRREACPVKLSFEIDCAARDQA